MKDEIKLVSQKPTEDKQEHLQPDTVSIDIWNDVRFGDIQAFNWFASCFRLEVSTQTVRCQAIGAYIPNENQVGVVRDSVQRVQRRGK